MMEETGAEVIEMRRTEDGLGFNIRGGRDSEYVQEDNGIFVSKIRERGTAAEMQAQKISPCLRVGDKLIEIDGHSLRNIDHNEAVNLFVTSGPVVRVKFIPQVYQKIIEQRELIRENELRKNRMWTICLSLIGVGALSLLVYKKYNGSVSIEKLFKRVKVTTS